MFTCLPLPVRPAEKTRLPAFWCGAAAASLALICLLYSGHSYSFTPPHTEYPPFEELFQLISVPSTCVHAVPAVGFISEVRASGPSVRAAVAVWPGNALAAKE